MNNERFNKITMDPIGCNCDYESLSCSLEYMEMIYYALEYVNCDFIYNKDSFVNYNTDKMPDEYLAPTNKLFFNYNDLSLYRNDFDEYIMSIFKRSLIKDNLESYCFSSITDMQSSCNKFPLILTGVDPFYLKDDYLKNKGKVTENHYSHDINLFDINIKAGTCTIVDKGFRVKGEISIESLMNSILASDSNSNKINACGINNINKANVIELLKKNLQTSIEDSVEIDGRKYYKNETGMHYFVNDFSSIIDELEGRFGIYAPQHISYPLIPHRHQRNSIWSLLYIINKELKINAIDNLVLKLKNSAQLWNTFDLVLDKTYLKNKNIKTKRNDLQDMIEKILNIEIDIMKCINEVYIVLNEHY